MFGMPIRVAQFSIMSILEVVLAYYATPCESLASDRRITKDTLVNMIMATACCKRRCLPWGMSA